MSSFSIGVDLGGTNLRIAAVSGDGKLLEKITLGVKVIQGRDEVINQMCAGIQQLSGKYTSQGSFLGAGIGVPGVIDLPKGMLRKSANLPGWEDYPVRAEIERRLKKPVVLENDANVAALGEQWLGAARGISNAATVTLGTGIGGGIVLNGKIWHGMNGMAGEFGHVMLEPEGHACGCGSHGCAEQYASASAVIRMAREAIASGGAAALAQVAATNPEFGAKAVYDLATRGDQPAERIFHTMGRYLGMLLSDLINSLNLDIYVIGGGVCSAWSAFAPSMFEELRRRSVVYAATAPDGNATAMNSTGKTIVTQALLGSDAGLYGAAKAAQPAA